jgi:hypothetical protein
MSNFDQAQKLNAAIAGLEAQRGTLGGAVVDAALAALRLQAAQLEQTESVDERKLVTIVFYPNGRADGTEQSRRSSIYRHQFDRTPNIGLILSFEPITRSAAT